MAVAQINESLGTNLSTLDLYTSPSIDLLLTKITTRENHRINEINLLNDLEKVAIKHM